MIIIKDIVNKTFKLLIGYLAIIAVIVLCRLGYNSEIVGLVILGGITMVVAITSVYFLKVKKASKG